MVVGFYQETVHGQELDLTLKLIARAMNRRCTYFPPHIPWYAQYKHEQYPDMLFDLFSYLSRIADSKKSSVKSFLIAFKRYAT